MRWLRPCLSILRMQLMAGLQYRAAVWAQFFTTIFWGFVDSTIILVFYRHGQGAAAGGGLTMTAVQAVSYVWMAQIVLHLLPGMSVDSEVRERIRSGDVSTELCRPLDLYLHWFARAAATRIAPFLLHLLPVAGIALLLPPPYRLQAPVSGAGLLACLLTLLLGLLLSCVTLQLTYVLLMHVNWGDGPIYLVQAVTVLLSGATLPLQLWPAWLQPFLYWQPFAGIMDLPLRLYLGTMPSAAVGQVALLELAWTAVLLWAGRLWMQKSLAQLVVQGG